MTELYRLKLQDLIKKHCLSYSHTPFTLASGIKSNWYVNIKNLMFDSNLETLVTCVDDAIGKIINTTCWVAVGSDEGCSPIIAGLAMYNRFFKGFRIRSKEKDHGTVSQIEGCFNPASPVILIDDVFTTGGSLLKSVEFLRNKYDVKDIQAIVVVNRTRHYIFNGIPIHSLCYLDQLTGTPL